MNQNQLEFIGLDTQYTTANGERLTRLHLDGAASPLACKAGTDAIQRLLPHYSNTHSHVHSSAQISTKALAWAHTQILEFVDASQDNYTSIFIGSGTTSAVNRVARGLSAARPEKKVVLVSSMEHHANDLPHRQFGNDVVYIPLTGSGAQAGTIDLVAFEKLLKQHQHKVNYVAVSSVSNVTGLINPVKEMAQLAHSYGAYIVVDGAQSVAHRPSNIDDSNIDFFIFSGHKLYTPGSPGVLIADQSVLREMGGQDLGGGSVSTVSYFDFAMLTDYPDREQSGTPNIVGAFALASVMTAMSSVGLTSVYKNEKVVMAALSKELSRLEKITVYGDHLLPRTGALAFNHSDIDHGLLAAILNDYFAIAVRNECFCAHPYVSSLLKEELWELDLSNIADEQQENYINRKRGMVRISISAYNTTDDVDRLIRAISSIEQNLETLKEFYTVQADGSYVHKNFSLDWRAELKI